MTQNVKNIETLIGKVISYENSGMIMRDAIYKVANDKSELDALIDHFSKTISSAVWAD